MKICIKGKIIDKTEKKKYQVANLGIYCGCFENKNCMYLELATFGKEIYQCSKLSII